jgi:hypothetical protein
MTLNELKAQAEKVIGEEIRETGFAEAVIEGRKILVTASIVGYNKPGRKEHVRFKVTDKGAA